MIKIALATFAVASTFVSATHRTPSKTHQAPKPAAKAQMLKLQCPIDSCEPSTCPTPCDTGCSK
ncbi:MAG: hypothetical protein QOJ65_2750 [Fimbriimonadaceae bacterium]|jgi:hypothetical protein|nr:hypothetical protein [Fimbriimonadaceae bacterium]